jgi:hypothetical protein
MPPKYRIWCSTDTLAEYAVANTMLKNRSCEKARIYASDASNPKYFHTVPDRIKKILYLDSPDLIVENLSENEPIFSLEISTEAGTGHNAFQRFGRIAASVENNCPSFYVYPEAVIIKRKESIRWDKINPLVFRALERVMRLHNIPALLYYYPSHYRDFSSDPKSCSQKPEKGLKNINSGRLRGMPMENDSEMEQLFKAMNLIIKETESTLIAGREKVINKTLICNKRDQMFAEWANRAQSDVIEDWAPLTATSVIKTKYLISYLSQYTGAGYSIGSLLNNRPNTLIYSIAAAFRGDPYPGCLVAIDYLKARNGKTFEEREYNLVLAWGEIETSPNGEIKVKKSKASIGDWTNKVINSESKNILKKTYSQLEPIEIPRYYMQCRYGSTFSKSKEIRIYSYFADAILFHDGALWRDG